MNFRVASSKRSHCVWGLLRDGHDSIPSVLSKGLCSSTLLPPLTRPWAFVATAPPTTPRRLRPSPNKCERVAIAEFLACQRGNPPPLCRECGPKQRRYWHGAAMLADIGTCANVAAVELTVVTAPTTPSPRRARAARVLGLPRSPRRPLAARSVIPKRTRCVGVAIAALLVATAVILAAFMSDSVLSLSGGTAWQRRPFSPRPSQGTVDSPLHAHSRKTHTTLLRSRSSRSTDEDDDAVVTSLGALTIDDGLNASIVAQPPVGSRGRAFVCVTGQMERLELASKFAHLFAPLLNHVDGVCSALASPIPLIYCSEICTFCITSSIWSFV